MEVKLQNAFLSVVLSDLGAELRSICAADGTQYLWQGDMAYWADRAPVLFPYVGRLTQGSYLVGAKRYQMGIHGFAAASQFCVREQGAHRVVLELTENEQTLAQYPFCFSFQVEYRLTQRRLDIVYRVENRNQTALYFGLGGHPGFCVPLEAGRQFEDYRLRFEAPCLPQRVGMSAGCFVTGESEPFALEHGRCLPLRHDLFDNDAIILTGMDRTVTLECPGAAHAVTVRFPQMPYLGIWHWPQTDAAYVCIEPWCTLPSREGVTEQLETQPGLICLEPGCVHDTPWSIEIS